VLDWAAESFGARLVLAEGVMPAAQDPAALARLAAAVDAHDAWALTALNELVTLSGSLLLGLAVSRGRLDAEVGWRLSRIDEDWNAAQWGEDAEAAAIAALKERDFHRAARLLVLLRAG
jgi:chaperone required for assembly of F1-ATPase